MHIDPYAETGSLYECTGCGSRVDSPDNDVCTVCDGTLMNLRVSRDL